MTDEFCTVTGFALPPAASPFGTMAEHRAMWNAQRETQGQANDDVAWQEFLFERWQAAEALLARTSCEPDRARAAREAK